METLTRFSVRGVSTGREDAQPRVLRPFIIEGFHSMSVNGGTGGSERIASILYTGLRNLNE